MGSNFSFCCSEAYFRSQRLPKEDSGFVKASSVVWIAKNIKQTYFLRKKGMQKKKNKEEQHQKKGKELTLEEWLLKSPIMEKHGNCNGDHCDLKHGSNCDYPSVARESVYFSEWGEYSLSLDQLSNGDDYSDLKDEKFDIKEMGFNPLTRSQSSKVKKRVSFRLPEVSETIILYPLEMDFNECQCIN
ncbi:hypothetical protein GLYMA_14G018150v4 [Glycine max]|nr:hypothetical protein GLYMA_14G018150v4 [Glycine max]KAH1092698.1 hypothetical protein GYH30_038753 [Glycine max]